MHRRQAALVVSVAALAAAGCGGSSSKSSTNSVRGIKGPPETARTASTPAVTGSTSTTSGGPNTASSANGFCNELSQALGQLVSNTGPDLAKQIAGMQSARDRLRALNPPAPAAGDYAKFISTLTTWINDLESRNTSAAQQDSATVIADEHAASRAAGCH
jgi:hypothetical protein